MRLFCIICLSLFIPVFAGAQEDGTGIVPSRGSIPDELLRPRRGEAPRYPIDTVIGELGQGSAPKTAYSFANSIAAGFLSGKMDSPVLASVNPVLRESYLSVLETIQPRSFRLGGGRVEADGSVSFLIRFIGKEQGITGELFIRPEPALQSSVPRKDAPQVKAPPEDVPLSDEALSEASLDEAPPEDEALSEASLSEASLSEDSGEQPEEEDDAEYLMEEDEVDINTVKNWVFDELILEEAKSREDEYKESLQHLEMQRFDFSPYERFF